VLIEGNYRRILNTRINATSYQAACDLIQHWATTQTSCYIVPANVHVVMTAYWHRTYQTVLNNAALVTPDGMPLVWALRLLGIQQQPRVYGPDLMLAWCEQAAQLSLPIYLYGGTERVLAKLQAHLHQQYPTLTIAGTCAPPFRPLTLAEEDADIEHIKQSGAKVVFIGLGCPKQEQWMYRQRGKFPGVMIGVGAAFNFFSGEVSQAPRWMMRFGLEWLYRFSQEPKRLWKRYLINNPAFVALFGLQLLNHWLTRPKAARSADEKQA
jgi:N-acetylglucosaminyldiphosphoundecaprenol N-acetyl-beta-D-mannosaminyltransferase